MVTLGFFSKAVKNEVSLCLNCQFFSEPEIFEALHQGLVQIFCIYCRFHPCGGILALCSGQESRKCVIDLD